MKKQKHLGETEEQQTTTGAPELFEQPKKPSKNLVPSSCQDCGDEFMPTAKHQRFCSDICRVRNFNKNKKLGATTMNAEEPHTPVQVSKAFNSLPGIPVHAQYVIDAQKREIEQWEKQFEKANKKLDEKTAEVEKLRDQLATIKTDRQIEEIRGQKPSGLNGLMESPVFKELMPHIGPALGRIADKLADAVPMPDTAAPVTPQQQLLGMDAQLQSIAEWYAEQTEETKTAVFNFMNRLAQLQPTVIVAKLSSALNALNGVITPQKNGTVHHN